MHLVELLVAEMLAVLRTGQGLTVEAVERSLAMLRASGDVSPSEVLTANILTNRGKAVRPKTLNQKRYTADIAFVTSSVISRQRNIGGGQGEPCDIRDQRIVA